MPASRRRLFSLAVPSVQILAACLNRPRERGAGVACAVLLLSDHGYAKFINSYNDGPFLLSHHTCGGASDYSQQDSRDGGGAAGLLSLAFFGPHGEVSSSSRWR